MHQRIEHCTGIVGGGKFLELYLPGLGIHFDFRDLNAHRGGVNPRAIAVARLDNDRRALRFDNLGITQTSFHPRVQDCALRQGDLIRRHAHLFGRRLLDRFHGLECCFVSRVAVDPRRPAAADAGVFFALAGVQRLNSDLAQGNF